MGASLSLGAIRAVASKSRPRRKAQAALRVWSAGVTQLSACGPALALVELSSIAAGMQAADAMAKRASIDVLKAGTVHNGKYLVLVGGQVADVEAAVRLATGALERPELLVRDVVIPQLHPGLWENVGESSWFGSQVMGKL